MKRHFSMTAKYNHWVNDRLYTMAASLPDEAYRRNVGVFFKSLHGTLNHLLTTDRIWMHRLDGKGDHPIGSMPLSLTIWLGCARRGMSRMSASTNSSRP